MHGPIMSEPYYEPYVVRHPLDYGMARTYSGGYIGPGASSKVSAVSGFFFFKLSFNSAAPSCLASSAGTLLSFVFSFSSSTSCSYSRSSSCYSFCLSVFSFPYSVSALRLPPSALRFPPSSFSFSYCSLSFSCFPFSSFPRSSLTPFFSLASPSFSALISNPDLP